MIRPATEEHKRGAVAAVTAQHHEGGHCWAALRFISSWDGAFPRVSCRITQFFPGLPSMDAYESRHYQERSSSGLVAKDCCSKRPPVGWGTLRFPRGQRRALITVGRLQRCGTRTRHTRQHHGRSLPSRRHYAELSIAVRAEGKVLRLDFWPRPMSRIDSCSQGATSLGHTAVNNSTTGHIEMPIQPSR